MRVKCFEGESAAAVEEGVEGCFEREDVAVGGEREEDIGKGPETDTAASTADAIEGEAKEASRVQYHNQREGQER